MDQKHHLSASQGSTNGSPLRRFYVLRDYHLRELRELLQAIVKRRDDILVHWHGLYGVYFGDQRPLSQAEFVHILQPVIVRGIAALLEGNVDGHAAELTGLGQILADRGLPLEEAIALFHLFDESVFTAFPHDHQPLERICFSYNKLSHLHVLLLATVYHSLNGALSRERITAPEQCAALMPRVSHWRFHGMVGASEPARLLYSRIETAAQSEGAVLIVGEAGTGKEMVARAVHEGGSGAEGPFVVLNCAALPRDLIESELFGCKPAPSSTGGPEYLGLLRIADGGTLFVDRITEMAVKTQDRLLRAVAERKVRPVGCGCDYPGDVRLIVSSEIPVKEAIDQGRLHNDFGCLRDSLIEVSPLRERRQDIPALAQHFIALLNQRFDRAVLGISQEALHAMMKYSWRGNIRELSEAIESFFALSNDHLMTLSDLPQAICISLAGREF